jgi:D-beta-D-heptose 7-phosphate kinase / D-beta-D-heptose 1-phosphate adenosyltransferase
MASMLETICAFADTHVTVFGDVMLDRYVHGLVWRISPEAPIPVIRFQREEVMLGGAGNVARNIARLGGNATLVSVRGDDESGRQLERTIATEARLEHHVICDVSRQTTLKTRYVANGQQLLRVDHEDEVPLSGEVSARLLESLAAALARTKVLVCSDYAKGTMTPATLEVAIARARAMGIPVVVDPKASDFRRYCGATAITPNAGEATRATGIACDSDEGVAEAARAIATIVGCRYVVVTRGSKGMSVLDTVSGGGITHLASEVREVHDVSGAGDSVVATLALGLASGAPVELASRLANLAGGIAVGKSGTTAVEAADLIAAAQGSRAAAGNTKFVGLSAAQAAVEAWRRQGERIVFANGCFDLLHPGHISLLQNAKAAGDKLIVAINSDASTGRLKGPGRPVQSETARAFVLSSIAAVDLVLVFDDDTPLAAIEALQPDVLVKGADYTQDQVVGGDVVRRRGGRVLLVPFVDGHSTTGAIERAARGAAVAPGGDT